jgi:hypothetical protein
VSQKGFFPWELEWPVDQAGYELEHWPAMEGSSLLGSSPPTDFIRAQGGPPRYYWPMQQHPCLYRQFAEICSSADGVLAFASRFGMSSVQQDFRKANGQREEVSAVLNTAELIRQICARVDVGNKPEAAGLWAEHAMPLVMVAISENESRTGFEEVLVPIDLRSALLLQTKDTIIRDQRVRRCRNEDCTEYFRVGQGAATERREFCSLRCRVASTRRQKKRNAATAAEHQLHREL